MLYPVDPKTPIYFGLRFKPYVKQGYMSGGAGYVLSKEAVKKFVQVNNLSNYKMSLIIKYKDLVVFQYKLI